MGLSILGRWSKEEEEEEEEEFLPALRNTVWPIYAPSQIHPPSAASSCLRMFSYGARV
jgi:hypothetical protein